MTSERLRELHRARPFRRFVIHLSDGRQLPVDHPELLAIAPSGRTAAVILKDDSSHWIDVLLVTDLEIKAGNGRAKRRSTHS
jgi:hypothetical protein